MKYILEIGIYTDGDFNLPFVPRGMMYVDEYTYIYKKTYDDRAIAVKDAVEICDFLKKQMDTSRDYVREDWNECVDNFMKNLKESKETEDEFVTSCMSGNYDGTKFAFYTEKQFVDFRLCVTVEEHKLISENRNRITDEMVKEAILALLKK